VRRKPGRWTAVQYGVAPHRYSAFGLELSSDFPLPGLSERAGGSSATVSLVLADPDAVREAWSGPTGELVWRTVSSMGSAVTGQPGAAGDFMLSIEGEAMFHLSSGRDRLLCAPLRTQAVEWLRFLLDTALVSTALLRGCTALHASVVAGPSGAVAFLGATGAGKTTIGAELVRRGYPLVSDDVAVVELTAAGAVVHPGPGLMNVPASSFWSAGSHGRVLGWFEHELWVEFDDRVSSAVPLAALALIDRQAEGPSGCRFAPASALDLLPHARGFNFTRDSELEAFDRMSRLAQTVPVCRLAADASLVGAELADIAEAALLVTSSQAAEVAG
jgi:hypothetical protein